jgi:hypothetical protein
MTAMSLGLPYQKVNADAFERNYGDGDVRLICVGQDIYNCMIQIEEGVLGPAFKDVHQLISSGPFLHSYVLALFRSHYAYSTLEDLPSNACESELSRVCDIYCFFLFISYFCTNSTIQIRSRRMLFKIVNFL